MQQTPYLYIEQMQDSQQSQHLQAERALSVTSEKNPVWEQARNVGPILALLATLNKITKSFFFLWW